MLRSYTACVALLFFASPAAEAFSQWGGAKGAGTQLGHEFLTLEAARAVSTRVTELRNTDFAALERQNATLLQILQRSELKSVFQHPANLSLEREQVVSYQKGPLSGYASFDAWSSAIGQRWVDVMGFGVGTYMSCFDNVAQLPDDVQPDHFLRRIGDAAGVAGRKSAFDEGVRRLRKYFRAAAVAPAGLIPVVDASVTQGYYLASRPHFLFGRALHLLQDSFSSEHTIREARSGWQKVEEIKNYNCTPGTPQHSHTLLVTLNPSDSGDVIWEWTKLGSWNVTNLKQPARWALEATKDLWIAFVNARKARTDPDRFIDPVIAKWFKLSTAPRAALTAAQMPSNCGNVTTATLRANDAAINRKRLECLRSTGTLSREDLLKPPFFWVWGKPGLGFQSNVDRLMSQASTHSPRPPPR